MAFGEIRAVYLTAYDHVAQAKREIANYFRRYNLERAHSSLNEQIPRRGLLGLDAVTQSRIK